ncbi:MAG: tRNA-dihydrouridine synthase family protein [Nanoarchaeota archaeon]|nr:tRNA-dihydrouridine synthase family protein [Nanoarchaeota archaeon]MBU4352560.1 tRNA-dihydrouridine synthase family protein [Nanoarchaeota archaeon]MBU4456337.1 tRNA-dihydrouridine synthase family protein [Nanoarchaeota archaeon]MCG2719183.1 tRNA-dihydrouridine synthase family protein [Nanoarchaeota archaeon]
MKKFQYMLAPIERITSPAFRNIAHKYGADLTFTEQIRAEGLAKNNKATWERLELIDNTPTVIQLTGIKESNFKKFLDKFEPKKAFKGINLNLGCPSHKVIQLGLGCAMVKRVNKTQKIIELIKDYSYEVSIKLRLGMNLFEKENKIYLNLINGTKADYYIVHARHGKQSYKSLADFSVYKECVETGKDIVANGDIKTKEHIDFLKDLGLKGAMIGRAAIFDPGIFNRLKGKTVPSPKEVLEEVKALTKKYDEPKRFVINLDNRNTHKPKKDRINKTYI